MSSARGARVVIRCDLLSLGYHCFLQWVSVTARILNIPINEFIYYISYLPIGVLPCGKWREQCLGNFQRPWGTVVIPNVVPYFLPSVQHLFQHVLSSINFLLSRRGSPRREKGCDKLPGESRWRLYFRQSIQYMHLHVFSIISCLPNELSIFPHTCSCIVFQLSRIFHVLTCFDFLNYLTCILNMSIGMFWL